jgi:2-C-methyl-D-erythritol 4-phosphate cytidylyltransferase/2-C-methyl-D-erythritol 2,4-cyclodiphosphate synthase
MTFATIHTILLAAGRSTRLGGDVAKPWRQIGGKMVLSHGLDRLAAHPRVDSGVIVVAEDAVADAKMLAAPYGWKVAVGGEERAYSVKAGLDVLAADAPDYVLIHDAARPFVADDVINRILEAFSQGHDAVIPAIAAADSLKTAHNNTITGHTVTGRVPRDDTYRIQTPQGFAFELIKRLHDDYTGGHTSDDASLYEDEGGAVHLIQGDAMMDKITTADDLARAELIAKGLQTEMMETRFATGFDVHKFNTGPGPIMLGGVAIDHDCGFDAHSDGDVVLHALTDAIYGTMAEGDIGSHFPPSDDQWKDADSAVFLTAATTQLSNMGGVIRFADITIIAEEPKIAPHRRAIQTRIAELLNLPQNRISIKATTSEGLGFTGRGEGIAVQAAVTVSVPSFSP